MSAISPAMAPGGGDVRARLQLALRAAMKARDTVAVSALRSTLAAIANAEAVPLPAALTTSGPTVPATPPPTASATDVHQYVAGSTAGLAAAEADRREVTEEDAAGIVQVEVAERQAAAREYQAAGHADRAERLLHEAQVIQSVLENIPGT
jgi:uncharacterized protein